MSSIKQESIIYSNKQWDDVVQHYNLRSQDMEILIHGKNTRTNTVAPHTKVNHKSTWLVRSLMLAGLVSILGNVPVSSHLLDSKDIHPQSFEISLNKSSNLSKDTGTEKPASTKVKTLELQAFDSEAEKPELAGLAPRELELPKRAIETYVGHVDTNANSQWKTYHVKSYDNLTNIFHQLGVKNSLKNLKKNKSIASTLKKFKKGSIARARSINGKLNELIFTNNNKNSFVITAKNNNYQGSWKKNIFEIRQSRASFTVRNGLFFDGRKAGISDKITKQIVKVFDWDIDFSHDVRVGDKVTAVFEEIYHDGDKVGNRNLLAAEFINKGKEFRAIRYTFKDGKSDFFTPQGREMKKTFIRTPIAHARVSSHFNPGRYHPILHKIKAHKGTDFAARTGTPIMATGNGTIKSIGRQAGYGRTVVIQHRDGYTTFYAHMSRFKKGLKVGANVYQGDTIGYVGSSGLATGPHLHYEFRKNNQPIDPMRASLPNSLSLTRNELRDFRSKAINLVLQLNVLHRFAKAEIKINSAIGG